MAAGLLVAVLLSMPISVMGACGEDQECDDISAWAVFTKIALKQSYSGSAATMEWEGAFDPETHDASIYISMRGSKEPMTGTVGLVGGQVMLTKGLQLQPGYEIDALDAPVLSMRLAMIVLNRLFPKGPDAIEGTVNIDRTDQVGIEYATPSASGYIPAPWHAKGTVSRLVDGKVSFEIALSFPMGGQDQQKNDFTINTKGEFAKLGRPVFRDADSLEGWTTYGLGPQQSKLDSSTIMDYGAKPQQVVYRTIGDVRASLAAENDPGIRDASKEFTGFWKKTCDDPFGLQIKHYGEDGKYSIVFCGPGGCGDPSMSRLTFITGDKRYEAVSESEIISIGRSGDRETYYRCSKDTNPVLKYRQ